MINKITIERKLMPIEIFQTDGKMQAKQSFDTPTVYLDHWALRLFSEDQSLQDRLVCALKSRGGTLLLSMISFSEFARVEDVRHIYEAESFIERLLPNIYLTDLALDKVVEQEQNESNNVRRFWPSADLPQLKLLIERSLLTFGKTLTMQGFVGLAHFHRSEIQHEVTKLVDLIRETIRDARTNLTYVSKVRSIRPSEASPRTHIILRELQRGFILDPTAPIADNDIIDLLHAMMSINCCDYVLLDGAWSERVEKMKLRIKKSGMEMPLAKCYSKRNHGINLFLANLENFPSKSDLSAQI